MTLHLPTVPRTGTRLDRLNPVTRLLMGTVLSVPLLITLDWLSATVALTGEIIALIWIGVDWRLMSRRMVPLLVAAVLAGVSMALYGEPGGDVHWEWFLVKITDNSLVLAQAVILRVLALGLPAVALFSGVDATEMADGLAQVFRMPAPLVLGALAGFRMLGVFSEDWRRLSLARRARGLGDVSRLKRFATMAFGLLVLALRRGTRLATAMEARGFGVGTVNRTWARASRLTWRDTVATLACALLIMIALGAAVVFDTFWFVGS